jgi:VWFA-related protein
MSTRLLKFLLISSLTGAVFGQVQSPAPSPTPSLDDDKVVISTNLIQVDVTVTDKKGRVVKGLTRDDFEIYENDERQEISAFSFMERSAVPTARPSIVADQPIPDPPRIPRVENIRRTIAVVVDDLNLSYPGINYTRQALQHFVDHQMENGDLVAIIRTAGGFGTIQQFTMDKTMLSAAIRNMKWNQVGSREADVFAPLGASFADMMRMANPYMSDEEYQQALGREREFENLRKQHFATGTLGALKFILEGMKNMPGRKSVMLISEGFSEVQVDRNNFSDRSQLIVNGVKNLIDLANRSSVVFYTVDPRGAVHTAISAADNVNGMPQASIARQLGDRRALLYESQAVLNQIASETGGLAFRNSNDLKAGLGRAIDDQSGYYLIGYVPDSDTFDAQTRRFNKLKVRVKRPDLEVRFRSGFFNEKETVQKPAKDTPPEQVLAESLISPFGRSDIDVSLSSYFGNGSGQAGQYIRSFLYLNARDISFQKQSDGSYVANFDIVAMAFGENGRLIDNLSRVQKAVVDERGYQTILERGVVYDFLFPVKKPGAYQMRIAVRDHATNKVGSTGQFIEVPDLKNGEPALSGIVLENMEVAAWEKLSAGTAQNSDNSSLASDNAFRRFRRGTVLRYGLEAYNAKNPGLTAKIRVFHHDSMLFEGKLSPLTPDEKDPALSRFGGAFLIGKDMSSGRYTLQAVVIDSRSKKVITQWISFEVAER